MSEQGGASVAAIQQRQAALARRHGAIAEADRVLAAALASAHQVMRDSVRRLDAISAEIEQALPGQPVDTPMGAREFERFLAAKQREIAEVVTEAREVSRSKSAVLHRLRDTYSI